MSISQEQVNDFLGVSALAVVGVSTDTSKYGWIVYQNLKGRGYRVYAVNPRYTEIHGEPCYPSVADLPEPVGLAVAVVPPAITEQLVPELAAAGIPRLWMQPGAESPAAVRAAAEAGLAAIADACIMVCRAGLGNGG